MIYQSSHQAPTMSSSRKTSPRPQHRNLQSSSARSSSSSSASSVTTKGKRCSDRPTGTERCRGRCRVQWSEKHVKEGLVLVQEAQLARVVKTGPITEYYEIDPKPFANGQWARVYRCRSRSTGTLYAAKYSSRNRFNTDCSAELRHEIALLSLCSQSPRVVKLHDVYETPKEIILVMEYAPGGDLQTLIDGDLVPLEGDVVHFVRQLVEGLAYLHERNIAHLDIKPQNLVMMGTFPECDVKLCDFEISRVVLEGTEVREILGTPDYVAPEILHYEPITLAADMWSLGVTTYVLLTGFSPFGGETDQETFQNISLGEVDFPEELFEDVSAQAKDFVARLLAPDPSARMTAKQCLRHDWLRGAPTQASPHLRRYLSKSREVLLERVVSRENLRRAALLSQATSHANLTESGQNPSSLGCNLSQSEMCLSYGLTGSRTSLPGSEESCVSPADSRTSLASSRDNFALSQSCLLNKEQTQGLLDQAQSRSQANLNHGSRNGRGLLSKMRNSNRTQSQACLLNGNKSVLQRREMNPLFSRSREKLYGLKSLSKSQGVLDIYRSLECVRKKKKNQRAMTEDMLPIFKQLSAEIAASNASLASIDDVGRREESLAAADDDAKILIGASINGDSERSEKDASRVTHDPEGTVERLMNDRGKPEVVESNLSAVSTTAKEKREKIDDEGYCLNVSPSKVSDGSQVDFAIAERKNDSKGTFGKKNKTQNGEEKSSETAKAKSPSYESEENMDSLQSIDSDTLTEDSDETSTDRKSSLLSVRQPSQRQHSDISSHSNNSGNSDEKEDHTDSEENEEPKYTVAQLVSAFNKHQEVASKTSLEAIMSEKRINEVNFPTGPKALRLFIPDINITESTIVRRKTSYKPRKNWEELRKRNEKNEGVLKDFDNDSGNEDDDDGAGGNERSVQEACGLSRESEKNLTNEEKQPERDLRDDEKKRAAEEELRATEDESMRQAEERIKIFCEEEQFELIDKDSNSREAANSRIDEKYKQCVDGVKSNRAIAEEIVKSPKASTISVPSKRGNHAACSPKERLANYIFPEITGPFRREEKQESCASSFVPSISIDSAAKATSRVASGRRDRPKELSKTDSGVNLKDILQKVDSFETSPRENLENLRKRTSIAKIIVNDNQIIDPINETNNNINNQDDENGASSLSINRARSELPSWAIEVSPKEVDRIKLDIPPSFVRSSSLSSEGSCPTPSSVQSDMGTSWEDVGRTRGSSTSLREEKEEHRGPYKRTSSSNDGKETSSPMSAEERKTWGKVCTGSYTRAMEKFNGKGTESNRKSMNLLGSPQLQSEKTRRKSTPAMSQFINP